MQNNSTFSPVSVNLDELVEYYRTGDTKAKGAVRSELTKTGQQALRDSNFELAVDCQNRLDAIKVPVATPAKEVNWVEVVGTRYAELRAELDAILAGDFTLPEGATMPDAEAVVDYATDHQASGEYSYKSGKAARGAVGDWIAAAVTDEFQTVAEMRNSGTIVDSYAAGTPGAGAVSAALNAVLEGKREIDGVTVSHDEKGRLGATSN